MAWRGAWQVLCYLTCPCQGPGILSSGDERKMFLMSCAAELSDRSCCMGVLYSASLHCTVVVPQQSFFSCQTFSRGAERAGRALCVIGFIHWHNTFFDDVVMIQVWCWMKCSIWCRGSAVDCWLRAQLRPLHWIHQLRQLNDDCVASSEAAAFWKP